MRCGNHLLHSVRPERAPTLQRAGSSTPQLDEGELRDINFLSAKNELEMRVQIFTYHIPLSTSAHAVANHDLCICRVLCPVD
mmetsp:Transcript_70668/g.118408  ORF Transcript_70668/g.118408 Transcript_70668/m.118408 type:complete len:82 (+) Transcript_70668:3-248(+)